MTKKLPSEHKRSGRAPVRKTQGKNFGEMLSDGGLTPHEIMIQAMRDENNFSAQERVQIARELMPYSVPRLNAVDPDIKTGDQTHEEWIDKMDAELDAHEQEKERVNDELAKSD